MTGLIFKIIGGVIIILASTMAGAVVAHGYSARVEQLRALQCCFRIFENEVVFMSNPICQAFMNIYHTQNNQIGCIFKNTADNLCSKKGLTACEAWEASIRQNIESTSLNKEDKAVLTDFGNMLGCSDRNGQVSNINMTIEKLKLQESKAEEKRKKFGSMYRKLGILGGLAIVILLF